MIVYFLADPSICGNERKFQLKSLIESYFHCIPIMYSVMMDQRNSTGVQVLAFVCGCVAVPDSVPMTLFDPSRLLLEHRAISDPSAMMSQNQEK